MNCNGCGGEFETLAGALGYGNASIAEVRGHSMISTDYQKTLCPRCQHVMKDILMSSDLSEQWDTYDWSLIGEEYIEPYND